VKYNKMRDLGHSPKTANKKAVRWQRREDREAATGGEAETQTTPAGKENSNPTHETNVGNEPADKSTADPKENSRQKRKRKRRRDPIPPSSSSGSSVPDEALGGPGPDGEDLWNHPRLEDIPDEIKFRKSVRYVPSRPEPEEDYDPADYPPPVEKREKKSAKKRRKH
jgi:hypothetical protein